MGAPALLTQDYLWEGSAEPGERANERAAMSTMPVDIWNAELSLPLLPCVPPACAILQGAAACSACFIPCQRMCAVEVGFCDPRNGGAASREMWGFFCAFHRNRQSIGDWDGEGRREEKNERDVGARLEGGDILIARTTAV